MKQTPILLPETAEEYLHNVQGVRVSVPVIMRDGRFLKVLYELVPRYSCKGEAISEDAEYCPDCEQKL